MMMFLFAMLVLLKDAGHMNQKKKKDQHLMKLQPSLKQILILLKRMLTRKNFLAMLNSLMKQKNLSIKPKVTENLTKLYQIFMNYMKLKA